MNTRRERIEGRRKQREDRDKTTSLAPRQHNTTATTQTYTCSDIFIRSVVCRLNDDNHPCIGTCYVYVRVHVLLVNDSKSIAKKKEVPLSYCQQKRRAPIVKTQKVAIDSRGVLPLVGSCLCESELRTGRQVTPSAVLPWPCLCPCLCRGLLARLASMCVTSAWAVCGVLCCCGTQSLCRCCNICYVVLVVSRAPTARMHDLPCSTCRDKTVLVPKASFATNAFRAPKRSLNSNPSTCPS